MMTISMIGKSRDDLVSEIGKLKRAEEKSIIFRANTNIAVLYMKAENKTEFCLRHLGRKDETSEEYWHRIKALKELSLKPYDPVSILKKKLEQLWYWKMESGHHI